jgi:hypothetical protein
MTSDTELPQTIDEFVDLVDALHDCAKKYDPTANPDMLVLDFLRHEEYDNFQWKALIGGVDRGFVSQAREAGFQVLKRFCDPVFGLGVKPAHFAAACAGVVSAGRPAGITANRGDITGWGGDWITFYGDWRRESDRFPEAYEFCRERLTSLEQRSTFMLDDLVDDAEAYNVAMAIIDGDSIVDVLRATYRNGQSTPRIMPFFAGRFGDAVTAASTAKNVLMPGTDVLVNLGRVHLVQTVGGFPTRQPDMLPDEEIDEFCRGFADVLLGRVTDEQRLLGHDRSRPQRT